MPRVTALRRDRHGHVAVELDGAYWRTLPLDAVLRAGLAVGTELDRPRARTVRRELRRAAALAAAARTWWIRSARSARNRAEWLLRSRPASSRMRSSRYRSVLGWTKSRAAASFCRQSASKNA